MPRDPSEEEIAAYVVNREPPTGILDATANWHLRQAERIIIDAEESEAAGIGWPESESARHSGKYGLDTLHQCKVAIWKLLDKLPENL